MSKAVKKTGTITCDLGSNIEGIMSVACAMVDIDLGFTHSSDCKKSTFDWEMTGDEEQIEKILKAINEELLR